MAEILLFHHALGLTPGMAGFAEALRSGGHHVETPDLFDGLVFDNVEAGVAHAESIGFEQLADRGAAVAEPRTGPFVVAGFSLGVLPAQRLAQQHPGVVGALLYHSAVPLSFFGGSWPLTVPAQIHIGTDDPFAADDEAAVAELVASGAELHHYPTAKHLIADSSSSDYEPAMAGQLLVRSLEFLADLPDS